MFDSKTGYLTELCLRQSLSRQSFALIFQQI